MPNLKSAIRNLKSKGRGPFRWTIKRKLIALGVGAVLPLAIVLALWIRREAEDVERETQSNLNLISQQAAGQVEMVVEVGRELEQRRQHIDSLLM